MRSHGPAALDFLATIHAKEHLPGGAGAYAILGDADRATLERLLRDYHEQGLTPALERRARTFLITYREMDRHAGVLDAAERERLGQVLDEPAAPPAPPARPAAPQVRPAARGRGAPWRWRWVSATAFAVLASAGLSFGVASYVGSHQAGPPTAVTSRPLPDQQALPRDTALQSLRRAYGPWTQLASPSTGSPALLLLQGGSYYASERWTVPPGAPGWGWAATSDVGSAALAGDHADITDADGTPYVVGIGQPFIISGDPGTVLRVDRAGTVWSLSLAQATAVRRSLGR